MRAKQATAAGSDALGAVTLEDVEAARVRLTGALIDTDCNWSRTLSDILGCKVWLKFENQQFTASFKERGALNRLSLLKPAEKARGVIAMSAGNHAQGVAYHAHRLAIPATIVMPVNTPTVKVTNTRAHGARVVLTGRRWRRRPPLRSATGSARGSPSSIPLTIPWLSPDRGRSALKCWRARPRS